ncbi:class I SAM-dependent methyltransferase [Argonema antarcticum]|uniref:class I SAM-dependent methyltransferase n=1 Tax=Argonema antarcticum TaxID=2942763 RepID=UPI0020111DFD|nr:class I SAM-dependent methyltransferase [Argonema antarcticum]MCL1472412.1 class I SAM-dependent methyltransferase [Argonema antarcticum A004/B2]
MTQEIAHPEFIKLQSAIDNLLNNRKNLKVLEAGCGSATHVKLGEEPYLIGIDISEKQLARNTYISEKIQGDIQTYNLPSNEYDAIICFYVLEHLDKPELAIKNFVRAAKEDGLIILAQPNVLSIWGLTTKFTPHWFHVWVYRNIFGEKRAGTDDFGPFKTFSRYSISPVALKQFAEEHNLSIAYFDLYENFRQEGMRKKFGPIWKLVEGMTKVLTFGQVDPDSTDFIIVLKKQKKEN